MGRNDYEGREQALVKHTILRSYLQRLALKVGQFRPGTTLNYVDGFSGPWDAVSRDFRDSSPHVAATELLAARNTLRARSTIELNVRCMFIEKDKEAFERLRSLALTLDGVETLTCQGEFESLIHDVQAFMRSGSNPFGFVFIDPTGWTGYGLKAIAPVLQLSPSEILINFMTKDIIRFIDDEDSTAIASFEDLFGEAVLRDRWKGLDGQDREDAIVDRYCERIRVEGRFSYCGSAVVLNPTQDRTHYHLIYATRSLRGLITFREVERGVAGLQKQTRAEARASKAYARTGQGQLFAPAPAEGNLVDRLIKRYSAVARDAIRTLVRDRRDVTYEDLLGLALRLPFVSEATVKDILAWLKESGQVVYVGLRQNERSPKVDRNIRIVARTGESGDSG
jgi:three-Cys-motif partner protein